MTIDISHLPKSMQKRPEIRAHSLKVYPGNGPRHFRVPGTDEIHDVYFFENTYHCGCRAGSTGRICAHAIAAQLYREKEK